MCRKPSKFGKVTRSASFTKAKKYDRIFFRQHLLFSNKGGRLIIMKRRFALLLAVIMAFSFMACASSFKPGEKLHLKPNKNISADQTVLDMSFTPPEDYVSVKRSIDRRSDGTITEKVMTYTFADGSELAFSSAKDVEEGQLEQVRDYISADKIENREIAGKSFMVFEYDELYAMCQEGTNAYGVQFVFPESEGEASEEPKTSELFDKSLEGLSFTDNTETAENAEGIDGISYTMDENLNVVSTFDVQEESKGGDLVSKSYTWRYGEGESIDFRFSICVVKNTTVDEQLDKDKTYSQATVGDITYTVRKDSDDKIFEYYTQQGSDVYIIRNLGDDSNWFTTRSEESYTAFENLINSVSFG